MQGERNFSRRDASSYRRSQLCSTSYSSWPQVLEYMPQPVTFSVFILFFKDFYAFSATINLVLRVLLPLHWGCAMSRILQSSNCGKPYFQIAFFSEEQHLCCCPAFPTISHSPFLIWIAPTNAPAQGQWFAGEWGNRISSWSQSHSVLEDSCNKVNNLKCCCRFHFTKPV